MDLLSLLWMMGLSAGAIVIAFGAGWFISRRRRPREDAPVSAKMLTQRVRAVGKLVALEVCAKEIATAKHGWDWLPPILLSPARIAMIFHYEKQYSVDLSSLGPGDVRERSPGVFRVRLPAIEGALRLTDVTPYDIQSGRLIGLLDIIQMNAERQTSLMRAAQEQATALFATSDARYLEAARLAAERQLASLLELFDVEIELAWSEPEQEEAQPRVDVTGRAKLLTGSAA